MRKSYCFRLYPTKRQRHLLQATLDECRWLYNHFLAQRKTAWAERQGSLSLYAQQAPLPALKQERPSLKQVHSQVLQNVAMRIDLAFKAFFRRVKAGEVPGYPRFRGAGWYDSFTYPQFGFHIGDGYVVLGKIGHVKAVLHRQPQGAIKTCTIRRTSTRKWYAYFSCEDVPADVVPEATEPVGIDVGLTNFATLSTGEAIANPRFFRTDERALAQAQRKLNKVPEDTPEREKPRKVVARIHERIGFRRHDFAHRHSRRLVNRYRLIAVEDISVNRLVHNHCLAKSISDAAWSQFFACLAYKAASARREYIKVDPAYTTQTCSQCGHRQKLSLRERTFDCPCCGLVLGRDHNAARNILRLGVGQHTLASA